MNLIDARIAAWLDRLAAALAVDDPVVRHGALSDARGHLLAALAELGSDADDRAVTSLLAEHGDPVEVADSYRTAVRRVQGDDQRASQVAVPAAPVASDVRALPSATWFGVVHDSSAWSALVYMLLALPLGVAWFAWTVLGGAVSGSLLLLIIGVPLALGYLASIQGIALVDGRIVEALLGERMPRRLRPTTSMDGGRVTRLRLRLGNRRTWTSIGYLIAMLPLGASYFLLAAAGLCVGTALTFAPALLAAVATSGDLHLTGRVWLLSLAVVPAGVCLLLATLHAARGIGALHGRLAKAMLVGGQGVVSPRRQVASSSLGRALALGMIALVLGGAAALTAAGMHRSQTSVHTERVAASDVQTLELDIDNADVRFVPSGSSPSGEVRVESRVTTFFQEQREHSGVTLETDNGRAVLSAACEDELVLLPGDCTVDVVVHVPSDHSIALSGRTDNGDVELGEGLGQIDLRTDNGEISGSVDAAAVSVSSDNGDVRLHLAHAGGGVTIQTENGDVELVASGPWQVEVHTDNGDQQVSVPSTPHAPRTIRVRTDNGDVDIS